MWRFTEVFMEDCIAEAPTAFLDESLELVARQQDLNGFRPDLILRDRSGRHVIVEIQQKALDRYHLYKCLEYRDLAAATNSASVPRVCLVCESIDEKYRQILRTHGVELMEISRERFIQLAVTNCSVTLARVLAADTATDFYAQKPASNSFETAKSRKFLFEALSWYDNCSPFRWLADLDAQLQKHDARIEDVPRNYYSEAYYDIGQFLDRGIIPILEEMVDLSKWNLKEIQDRATNPSSNISAREKGSLWKPQIDVVPYITSKDNLSVIWRPTNSVLGGSLDGDWIEYPGDSTYGWSRPANELLFIKSVRHFDPSENRLNKWDDRVNWHVLSELFIGLTRATFNYLVECLRSIFTVTLINDFEFDTRDEPKENECYGKCTRITGWRIYNLEDRKTEQVNAWFSDFEKNFGISIDEFIDTYKTALNDSRRAPHNWAKHVSKDLSIRGIRISAGEVATVVEKIKAERPYMACFSNWPVEVKRFQAFLPIGY